LFGRQRRQRIINGSQKLMALELLVGTLGD
jgi:hypothetical protein